MTPETALSETVDVLAAQAERFSDTPSSAPWLVIASVLAAQQAATLALRAAGDSIPAQAGATELLLRAASKDRLPVPFTLPFGAQARQSFEGLVEARNQFMHPRGQIWQISDAPLWRGVRVAARTVRHLILTQPVLEDLVAPNQQNLIRSDLQTLDLIADFYDDPHA
ncbi:MAG: hypothetical protein AAFY82_02470 [Pseudomonadota bacterium]